MATTPFSPRDSMSNSVLFHQTEPESQGLSLRWLIAVLAIVGLIALAVTGNQRAQPESQQAGGQVQADPAQSQPAERQQSFDGRGKWTGYAR